MDSINKIFSEYAEQDDLFPVITDGDDVIGHDFEMPEELPLLALRNIVVFPGVVTQLSVGRSQSQILIKEAYEKGLPIGTIAQRKIQTENPGFEDIFRVGTVARIVKIFEMPNGGKTVLVQGRQRFQIEAPIRKEPYMTARVSPFGEYSDYDSGEKKQQYDIIFEAIKEVVLKIVKASQKVSQEIAFAVKNIENKHFLVNFISSHCSANHIDKQKLLEETSLYSRAKRLLALLTDELQVLELKSDIQKKVRNEMNKQQKEYYLNQQIKTLQDELGNNPADVEVKELSKKAKKIKWKKEVQEHFEKELNKLKTLNTTTGEYSSQLTYLNLMVELPWDKSTKDNYDLNKALEVLNEEHYGLEKVKDRILEHLAVIKLKKNLKAPIICLYGPPGVGKTSLGKSIAKAVSREYVRVSLGGLHDESEIRGHRKTYIGAMPGRIIQGIKKAQTSNPVFVLDEIDKVGGRSVHGDPQSALLEVLDPEQNEKFHDNYLDVDYDLSSVMFIATANDISQISAPLRDRMEMIEINGYLMEEKHEIAKRHLIGKQIETNGLDPNKLNFSPEVISYIIDSYTRESGVRGLEKNIGSIVRKIVKKVATQEDYNQELTPADVREFLGVERFTRESYEDNSFAGVVTGLAWTSVGGDILFVETSVAPGKGKLSITGNLGAVMKESVTIALDYIKSKSEVYQISPEVFDKHDIHIHVPEGAVPKDGPSAGITMATSIVSALTQKKVRAKLAMTGEVTLRGKVLPVGGIKEKILAAKRAGIERIILSKENERHITDIPSKYIDGLDFDYVSNVDEVISFAVLDELVDKPLKALVN